MNKERLIAECWPITVFVEEELRERDVPLKSLLKLVDITPQRWASLKSGEGLALFSECYRLAGALGVDRHLIANLNRGYAEWKKSARTITKGN